MPNLTTNYSLKKPIKATENADIDVINGNMDILDASLKANATAIGTKANQSYVVSEINSLKSSVNSGKDNVYSAIVGKKITPTSKDFSALVTGINNIKLGQGNAVESDVINPKTFTNDDGIKRAGSIVDRGAVTITPSASNQSIANGKHTNSMVLGDTGLIASNIKKGVNIFGVLGTNAPIIAAGDNIGIASVTEKIASTTSYVKLKEMKINATGRVRVKYLLRTSENGHYVNADVFINGSPTGYERKTWDPSFVQYVQDIDVTSGDLIQIWGKIFINEGHVCILGNTSICYGTTDLFSITLQ